MYMVALKVWLHAEAASPEVHGWPGEPCTGHMQSVSDQVVSTALILLFLIAQFQTCSKCLLVFARLHDSLQVERD